VVPDDVLAKIKYMHSYEKLKKKQRNGNLRRRHFLLIMLKGHLDHHVQYRTVQTAMNESLKMTIQDFDVWRDKGVFSFRISS